MADPIPTAEHPGSSPPPTPRWVKMFGLVVIALVLLFVIKHLAGGGFRGHLGQ